MYENQAKDNLLTPEDVDARLRISRLTVAIGIGAAS